MNLFTFRLRKHRQFAVSLAVLLVAIAPLLPSQAMTGQLPASKETHPRPTASEGKYNRLLKKSDGTYAAQFANRVFSPADGVGPKIMLISAIHIGSKEYYGHLQNLLDTQDVLLFEGISENPDDFKKRLLSPGKKDAGLYGQLAVALGLVPQTLALDYNREHFINADLSPKKLRIILEHEVQKGGKEVQEAE